MSLIIKKENNYELLKIVALLIMVFDHVGYILFPEQEWMRWVGRIGFPLFVFQYVVSFDKTSNRLKGLKNVWLFVVISQIPYMVFINIHNYSDTLFIRWSIFLPLALGFTLLYIIHATTWSRLNKGLIATLITASCFVIPMDYGWLVPISILVLYQLRKHFYLQLLVFGLANAIFTFESGVMTYQLLSFFGFAIAPLLYKVKLSFIFNKYVHYWFYPVHLVGICIIYYLI